MSLGRHVDSDELIKASKDHAHRKHAGRPELHGVPYASRYAIDEDLPRYKLPVNGVDAKVAYQLLHDELALDGNPNMNLASFVHTWVPDECQKLMEENLNKNLVDQDEYPAARDIHERCISMIADLWHAPPSDHKSAIGTATTGSSEAIMLGGLAMKNRWRAKMKEAGKDIHRPGPNIVMGANAQVALEKFARYFDVEARLVPVTEESNYVMSPEEAMKYVDENTIGVFVILGSTYTGHFENVSAMSSLLDEYESKTGNHVPIHVDAASGGFVAPFAYPTYAWDFKIPRVCSINASSHKYGLTSVGMGVVVWRSPDYLPAEMVFELHYLGQTDYSFNLNFSRPAHPILAQMFNFINLGFEGYRRIAQGNLKKARVLSRALEKSGYFTVLSQIHHAKPASTAAGGASAVDAAEGTISNLAGQLASKVNMDVGTSAKDKDEALKQRAGKTFSEDDAEYYLEGLPVVSFRFTDKVKEEYPDVKQAWVQEQLRAIGWIVPNYPLPPSCDKTEILRVVVRESLSGDLIRKLIADIFEVTERLLEGDGPSVAMLLAANRSARAGKQGKKDNKTPEKHKDMSEDHKAKIAENTSTWAKPC